MKKYILDTLTEKVDIMKMNRSLLKRTLTVSIIVMMSFFVLTTSFITMTGESKVDAPKWSNGDDWHYKLIRDEGEATFKAEVNSENANFKIDEETYKCYMVERVWNLPNNSTTVIKKFYTKEKLAEVGEINQDGKRTYFGEPLNRLDFPLEVEEFWVGNTLQYQQGAQEKEGEVKSKVNYTYRVMEETEVSVKAGTFDAYKLNGTIINTDPSKPGSSSGQYKQYVHFYYAPAVKNYVKIVNYYGGTEMGTQELYSFNVSETNSNDSPSIGTVTLGATAFSMVVLYNIVKKKREE